MADYRGMTFGFDAAGRLSNPTPQEAIERGADEVLVYEGGVLVARHTQDGAED